jgi:hypothetical protein
VKSHSAEVDVNIMIIGNISIKAAKALIPYSLVLLNNTVACHSIYLGDP